MTYAVTNSDIRGYMRFRLVPIWKVAQAMEVSEMTLTRKLRTEFTDQEKKDFRLLVDQIAHAQDKERKDYQIAHAQDKERKEKMTIDDDTQDESALKEDEETRSKMIVFRKAKFGLDPYVTLTHGASWSLSLKINSYNCERWRGIIRLTNKQDVIDAIPELIADLTGIYKMLTGIDKEEK